MKSLGRRRFLRAAAAATAAGATLPILSPGSGHAAPDCPKRILFVFTPNGTIRPEFWPTGGETSFSFGRILAPLEPFKDQMLLLKGINMNTRSEGPGNGHTKGIGHLLTGVELLEEISSTVWGGHPDTQAALSVDQEIAKVIGAETRLESLVMGCRVRIPATPVRARLSYRAANEPIVPNDDPYNIASLMFGDGGDEAALRAQWARRESLLDNSTVELDHLRTIAGADDRARIDSHLTAIRDLERSLAPDANICEVITPEGGIDVAAESAYPTVSRLQMDLVARAFECDITRVGSILYSSTQSGQRFPWLGVTDSHHGLSHEPDSNGSAQDKLTDINTWYAGEIAHLLTTLDSVVEADGSTLLDNTLVVWCNEMGTGNSHSKDDLPFVLAGGGAGFRMGRYLQYGGEPHNNLLLSLANAYGLGLDSFGDERYCTGELDNLT